jgi:prepilin-type processing-associated H-X9-DG protein
VKKKFAFTLVELCVVTAIIGVLIAILLPTIQAAREAARRIKCSSNMKQIGLGHHNYYSTNNTFPPGHIGARMTAQPNAIPRTWVNPNTTDPSQPATAPKQLNSQTGRNELPTANDVGKEAGWALFILPFIEQTSVYAAYNSDLWIDHPDNKQAVQTPISIYLCPSKHINDPLTHPASTFPAASKPNGFKAARLHYAGLASSILLNPDIGLNDKDGKAKGMLYCLTTVLSLGVENYQRRNAEPVADVPDGFSNTMMVTEDSKHADGAWCSGRNIFQLSKYHIYSDKGIYTADTMSDIRGCTQRRPLNDKTQNQNGFHAEHPGGLNAQFADGSVKFIANEIDWFVLRCWVNRMDGDVFVVP